MLKPPAPTMPGMTDTLDFVKNLWGAMNIPGTGMPGASGIAAPTLSTDDLDKRIADLKAVESWLNMNIGMLRGTIQAMEVQRGTLAAIKSMGSSMAEAMRQSGVGTDKMASLPFMPFFNPAPGKPGSAEDAAAAQAAAKPPSGGAAKAPSGGAASAQPGATAPASAEDASAALGMPAALAWWNLLQDQFQQAVSSAITPTASAVPGAPGTPAAPAASAAAGAPSPSNGKAAAPAPQSGSASGAGGNGKARAPKSRTDKA
jgi:hypothetical protein